MTSLRGGFSAVGARWRLGSVQFLIISCKSHQKHTRAAGAQSVRSYAQRHSKPVFTHYAYACTHYVTRYAISPYFTVGSMTYEFLFYMQLKMKSGWRVSMVQWLAYPYVNRKVPEFESTRGHWVSEISPDVKFPYPAVLPPTDFGVEAKHHKCNIPPSMSQYPTGIVYLYQLIIFYLFKSCILLRFQ